MRKLSTQLLLGGLVLVGSPALAEDARPAWVHLKSAWCRRGGEVVAMASGSSDGIRNVSLARTTAANRARSQLLRHIQGKETGFVSGSLNGAEIAEQWQDPDTCTQSALAVVAAPAPSEDVPTCEALLLSLAQQAQAPRSVTPSLRLSVPLIMEGEAALEPTPDGASLEVTVIGYGPVHSDPVELRAKLIGAPSDVVLLSPVTALQDVGCSGASARIGLRFGRDRAPGPLPKLELTLVDLNRLSLTTVSSFALRWPEAPPSASPSASPSAPLPALAALDVSLVDAARLMPGRLVRAEAKVSGGPAVLKVVGEAAHWFEVVEPTQPLVLTLRLTAAYQGPAEVPLELALNDASGAEIERRVVWLGLGLSLGAASPQRRGLTAGVFTGVVPKSLSLRPDDAYTLGRWLLYALRSEGVHAHLEKPAGKDAITSRTGQNALSGAIAPAGGFTPPITGQDPACLGSRCQAAALKQSGSTFVAGLRLIQGKGSCAVEVVWLAADRRSGVERVEVACTREALFEGVGQAARSVADRATPR